MQHFGGRMHNEVVKRRDPWRAPACRFCPLALEHVISEGLSKGQLGVGPGLGLAL